MNSVNLPTLRKLILIAAWASIGVAAYGSLMRATFVYDLYYRISPLIAHPSMRAYGSVEHFVAYSIIGILFCALYPRSWLRVYLLLLLFIGGLEVLQTLTPDRHGTLHDAVEKMMGGVIGVGLVKVVLWWRRSAASSLLTDDPQIVASQSKDL